MGLEGEDPGFMRPEEEHGTHEDSPLISPPLRSYVTYVKYILFFNGFISLVFYGFNATLNEYFENDLSFDPSVSSFLTNMFIATNYTFSLVGGVVADEFLGKIRVVNYSCSLMTFGTLVAFAFQFTYTFWDQSWSSYCVFIGLFLVAMGNGAVIPCVSSLIGDQFNASETKKRTEYFSWYYLFTQFGSILSTSLAPYAMQHSASMTFLIYFVVLLLTLQFCFRIWRKKFNCVEPNKGIYKMVLSVLWAGIKLPGDKSYGKHWLDKTMRIYAEADVQDVKVVVKVLLLFIPMPIFWAIYFQIFSLWVEQAEAMNLVVFGITIPASSTTALNPIFDLFLIPFLAKGVYPLFDKIGKPIMPLQRMAAGLFFTCLSSGTAALVDAANSHNQLSALWLIPQYFLISCAEITLSVTAIEFAYTQAPARMKSAVSACWFSTVAVGNVLVAIVALIPITSGWESIIFSVIMFVMGVWLLFVSIGYKYAPKGSVEVLVAAEKEQPSADTAIQA